MKGGVHMPIEGQMHLITISVYCPRDRGTVYKMPIDLMWIPEQRWFPLECNGCDNLNGDPICSRCRHNLTLLFFENPDWRPLQAIDPLRPIDQQPS